MTDRAFECSSCGRVGPWGPAWSRTREGDISCSADCKRGLAVRRTMSGLPMYVDRISLNGCRYIASEHRWVMERICEMKGIDKKWLRYSERHRKFYLRLWGRFKKA